MIPRPPAPRPADPPLISLLPPPAFSITSSNAQNCPFGGNAVLIMVGVALDTVKQIESQLMQRNYEGFLR